MWLAGFQKIKRIKKQKIRRPLSSVVTTVWKLLKKDIMHTKENWGLFHKDTK